MMKLKSLMPEVIERFMKLNNVRAYAKNLKDSKEYNSYEVRLAWDLLRAVFNADEICEWYEKYDCHDQHITSMAVSAMHKVFDNELKDLF